ncbi:enoyl-CoA hydratase/isomerase family protein [Pusillimonas sp. TS35]|uniref:enoyl-CoA hydratase/isomerase family protein n=1 Tax=Paracandidimonas lactea TaxID=2895524 RepID=UPI0013693016|nr:enoyl-CoA hydratase/isomerase family protein [Paracandidimonas lactea]MYN12176.1 enoyl-CoA hydratase/isomerase family protein [Pusillimonas sp. TS35]
MNAPVLFRELDTASGKKIGVATLNSPKSLNSLTLEMCRMLAQRLAQWQDDDSIAMVVLDAEGGKAFCAGGDLTGMYQGMLDNTDKDPWNNVHAREFFDVEYRLDYQIHTYLKPLLCWGSGIVMGGGVGLMMGASHRVVSETTRFAMPEISIGLFPDVGGTWMLARLPGGIGTFLALTAAQIGAADCLRLGLADYMIDTARWGAVMEQLPTLPWTGEAAQDHALLRQALLSFKPPKALPPGPLDTHFARIREACDSADFEAVCANIAGFEAEADPWLQRAAKTFKAGSPGSARLSFTLLQRVRLMSLADVFREEYIVSLQCGVQGDLQEGIRALIIDKDKTPRWNPATPAEATAQWVQRFFQAPWPASMPHPLRDLGRG